MPLRIFNNLNSQVAQNRLDVNNRNLGRAISTVASGERIQNSSDDGASLAISESLRSDARAFRQGLRNVQDGLSLINNVAEGGLTVLAGILIDPGNLLHRLLQAPLVLQKEQLCNWSLRL